MLHTKAQAQVEIAKLVDTFAASEARLQNEAEAQIENTFIRPLFECLNWNTRNDGLRVTEYEFLVQKTDRYGKRPDYIVRLDGQHLFVMDAKQVKYAMHDPRWLNQVYAYAYSTQNLAPARKIDFAILTDFQEFIVLDCTLYAGDPKALPNFRVLDWRYPDYVTHFETLWELFERENVRAALRTRGTEHPAGLWARQLSPKKVKANRIPPDKTFLAAMDDDATGWRVRLAKDMKKRNPQADGALITAAVQLLINRLIFVKVLSDREIEDDYLARLAETVERDGLAEDVTGWFTACRAIFEKLNTFYNGSVFEPRPELEAVSVSNKVVRDILRAMQPEQSPYNFAMLPVEILGTIYERFLGRVVRTTDQRVKIEDKPEVRKAGGVYYTPQYIVAYIVQQTVGKLLETCRAPDDVAKLKILDPACGSGSFLLGAYTALLDWHVRYYSDKTRLTKKDRAAAYYDADGGVRLTAKLKRQILLDNLFGVDIDAQAVEVTRFSLSLKALEETRHDELLEEWSLFKMTVLPDLRDNIKCGNSLIGPDYFTNQLIPDMAELKRVNPFDWTREFSDVMKNGGFDGVIGNPPYIRIQTLQETNPAQVTYLKQLYRAAGSGNYDIYVVFVEKGLSLLNERGRLGFILPHKFFNAKYGEPLRDILSEGKHLAHVVHFGDQQVFDGATTYTALMFLDKQGNDAFDVVRVSDLDTWQTGEPQTHGEVKAKTVTSAEWNFTIGKGVALFERLNQMPIKLEDVSDKIFQGLVTSSDPVYLLEPMGVEESGLVAVKSKATKKDYKLETEVVHPLCKGARDIRRYCAMSSKRVLFPYDSKTSAETGKTVLIPKKEFAQRFPRAWEYLNENFDILRNREKGKMRHDGWYGYVYPKSVTLFVKRKILTPSIASEASYTLDNQGELYFVGSGGGGGGGYGIILKNDCLMAYEYILGLLNSHLLDYFLKRISSTFQGGYYAYNRQYIEQLPIRAINFYDLADKARHDNMVQLVAAMLELHKRKAAATTQPDQELYQRQIDATDRQIDALVYELYGLTEEEITIVET